MIWSAGSRRSSGGSSPGAITKTPIGVLSVRHDPFSIEPSRRSSCDGLHLAVPPSPQRLRVRYALEDPWKLVVALGLERGAKPQRNGVLVRCPDPGHEDGSPSCSVRLCADRTVGAHCFAFTLTATPSPSSPLLSGSTRVPTFPPSSRRRPRFLRNSSGRRDLNPRQRAPKARALPDCATPRRSARAPRSEP